MPQIDQLTELLHRQEALVPELKRYVHKKGSLPMLRHPLLYSVPYMEQMNALLNAQFEYKQRAVKEALVKKNFEGYVWMHERPWRMNAFLEVREKLTPTKYWRVLRYVLVDTENFWQFKDVMSSLFDKHPLYRQYIMDAAERKFLAKLPSEVTIYRGCNRRNKAGYSWSLSKERADWFAKRFNEKTATVLTGICNRNDIIGYFSTRNEEEILINPAKVKILTKKEGK